MKTLTAQRRWNAPAAGLAAAVLVASATACGDDPFAFRWDDTPDTVQLYSLARPELNLVSAFNFFEGTALAVESPSATGGWDVAIDTDPEGSSLLFMPPGALGITTRARIAALPGIAFGDITEAPEDTTVYVADAAVPVNESTIYVVRTNRRRGSFGSFCVYYAKVEPVVIDVAGGRLTFQYVSSPICNSRDLVPPD